MYTCQVKDCLEIGTPHELPGRDEKRNLCSRHWLELLKMIHDAFPKEFRRRDRAKAKKQLKKVTQEWLASTLKQHSEEN